MTKVPTRSPTDEPIEPGRLTGMGLELEDIADGPIDQQTVALAKLVELSEDRGRPASHYIAALPLATELKLAPTGAALHLKVCAGNCQRYGALGLIDQLVEQVAAGKLAVNLVPVDCLDRCDMAPACELHGAHGALVLAPAKLATITEAVVSLS